MTIGAFFFPTTIGCNLISLANEKLSPINNLAKIKIKVFNILKVIIYVYMKHFCLYIFNLIIAIFNNLYFINSFKTKKIIC